MAHKMIRALVADDSSPVRALVNQGIRIHQEKRYFEIENSEDGQKAIDALRKKPFDLAFIDINMPGLTGSQVVAAMSETQSKGCLSIAISSQMDGGHEKVLKDFGAYHFLQKPFSKQDVADIVSAYMTMTEVYPVMIVDDSATMRKLTRKTLDGSRFQFDVDEAGSAEEARRKLRRGDFRIVITDFHMPDIDGLELAGMIRELSSKVAIYMMSTNDTTYLERSAAFIGINGFLKKPFNSSDIDSLMHKLLGLEDPKFGKVRDLFSFLERDKKAS
ncbi:response regulator [Roseibium algae]|uniref:Response regulator n=1 Tax=Roseibium algae TaxID=3123038 RepID=A0ABU8TNL5_9HYPH